MDTERSSAFAARLSVEQVEEGQDFAPKFDVDGLIACVTSDADTSDVLMVGYMNAEALQRTIERGQSLYCSRSRQCLWQRNATSGGPYALVYQEDSKTFDPIQVCGDAPNPTQL